MFLRGRVGIASASDGGKAILSIRRIRIVQRGEAVGTVVTAYALLYAAGQVNPKIT